MHKMIARSRRSRTDEVPNEAMSSLTVFESRCRTRPLRRCGTIGTASSKPVAQTLGAKEPEERTQRRGYQLQRLWLIAARRRGHELDHPSSSQLLDLKSTVREAFVQERPSPPGIVDTGASTDTACSSQMVIEGGERHRRRPTRVRRHQLLLVLRPHGRTDKERRGYVQFLLAPRVLIPASTRSSLPPTAPDCT